MSGTQGDSSQHQVRVGTSGWVYPPWRGTFYPPGLPHRRELEYLSRRVNTVEINGSFYSLQRPSSYQSWVAQTPEDFVFAVKGGRFITHMKRLRDVETPLANFFASGVLALGPKLGPVLWQLPPTVAFDADRLDSFLRLLPRSTAEAAALAQRHDQRLENRAWTSTDVDRPVRHALEARHPSFRDPALIELLRAHGVALVVADTAHTWLYLEDLTADFVYVRLHGDTELYVSGYTDEALDLWSQRVRGWQAGESPHTAHTIAPPGPLRPREVFVYFDNDVKVRAPLDAISLAQRLAHPRAHLRELCE
jgi:uncharacterized protein YecE (DUF72 family)